MGGVKKHRGLLVGVKNTGVEPPVRERSFAFVRRGFGWCSFVCCSHGRPAQATLIIVREQPPVRERSYFVRVRLEVLDGITKWVVFTNTGVWLVLITPGYV